MPSGRRTRAMGYSPGGPKALDINAPTRQTRKAKSPADDPEPPTRTTRARAGPKRKNEDLTEEQPPAKKTRVTRPTQNPKTIASSSQALTTLPDSGSDDLPESTSLQQEHEPDREPEKAAETRVNAQQPTPPLDTPINVTPPQLTLEANEANDERQKKERRISDMIKAYWGKVPEEKEDEKALSECDDDEWEERYSAVMEQARNPTPFISKPNSSWEKTVPGSATKTQWEPQQNALSAEKQSGHRMTPLSSTTNPFTIASLLTALSARPVTRIDTIVAISASLDWYEKNPAVIAPNAVEMRAMLDDFARAKQAADSPSFNPTIIETLNSHIPNTPLTPRAQLTNYESRETLNLAESDDDHLEVDDQEELGMKKHGAVSTNKEFSTTERSDPRTPPQKHQPSISQIWASALSASTIGNVLLTPVNWFTRRNREKQNISATEPRPVRVQPESRRSSSGQKKIRPQHTSAKTDKRFMREKISPRNLEASPAPHSPTPTASQPRRGRPDSHLPVHLRGVRYEDLPSEWQAVSQHLRKPTYEQIEDVEEDEDSPVNMERLLAIARRTREERAAKERELKAQAEQTELSVQQNRDVESNAKSPVNRVNLVGKNRVTFSPQKIYSAKLGHSTYGMPLNIDDSSSSEEEEEEEEEEDEEFFEPRTHFGRSSRPLKSCLKRAYQQPTFEDSDELEGGIGDEEFRPTKKARLAETALSQRTEAPETPLGVIENSKGSGSSLYENDLHHARPPNKFISKPPSEVRMAEAAQREYERLQPPSPTRSAGFSQINNTPISLKKKPGNSNVFSRGGRVQTEVIAGTPQKPVTFHQGLPTENNGVLLPPGSLQDESDRLGGSIGPLMETRNAQLNKQREDVLKHKPKVSSTLQITQISSPPHETSPQAKKQPAQANEKPSQIDKQTSPIYEKPVRTEKQPVSVSEPPSRCGGQQSLLQEMPSDIQEKLTRIQERMPLRDFVFDDEVLAAIDLITEEDIVAEIFDIKSGQVEIEFEPPVLNAVNEAFESSS